MKNMRHLYLIYNQENRNKNIDNTRFGEVNFQGVSKRMIEFECKGLGNSIAITLFGG